MFDLMIILTIGWKVAKILVGVGVFCAVARWTLHKIVKACSLISRLFVSPLLKDVGTILNLVAEHKNKKADQEERSPEEDPVFEGKKGDPIEGEGTVR